MNRSKRPMPAQLKKKMNKEIRAATPPKSIRPTSDDIKANDLLSRYPEKLKKKGSSILDSLQKTINAKSKKKIAKHSKRTTPGQVGLESPPKVVHVEGKRWIKTLVKQNVVQSRSLAKKMSKKGMK